MKLLYYRFDVSGLSTEERRSVASALDMQAHTGCIIDARNRNIFYSFFPESINMDDLKTYFPVLYKCHITLTTP